MAEAALVFLSIDDALHYTPEERAERIAGYAAHERAARARGVPLFGSGLVFSIDDELITIEPFVLPEWFVYVGGLDPGFDPDPTAAVRLAWDREDDVVYVTREYVVERETPPVHAAALRRWGETMPWAWGAGDKAGGRDGSLSVRDQYQLAELNMLAEHAHYPSKSVSIEGGCLDLLTRMREGRFKVFSTCQKWMQEKRLYHRKDGKIVDKHNHLMDATRYGLMMLRHAQLLRQRSRQGGVHYAPEVLSHYDETRWNSSYE